MRAVGAVVQAIPRPYRTDPASTLVRVPVPDLRYKNPRENDILYPCHFGGPEQKTPRKCHFVPLGDEGG